MAQKILCVAEKPSIAKAVANHLAGGNAQPSSTRNKYIKNYSFTFDFGGQWGNCNAVMTSVLGHLTTLDVAPSHKNWTSPPPEDLFFGAQVIESVVDDKRDIAQNIQSQARGAKALFIWTDCDREGEHIGSEVRAQALKGNPRIEIKRARFSNIERAHVIQAAKNPVDLDQRQVDALGGPLENAMMSYGSCQFPTLGFVVERYFKVQNFVPEPFWSIKVTHSRENMNVIFNWKRNRLFDRAVVIIIFERCLAAKMAKVTKVQEKPTKKWKPLPLTTVELQKAASRWLHMNSQVAMTAAESLYTKGFISYPRTETDRFDKGMNLRALVEKQAQDNRWGPFAQNLVNGGFHWPREGRNDDKAHPPIHPVTYVALTALNPIEARVYEFVVRRFLACCSEDAKGQATDVELEYGDEIFNTHGLVVLEKNYLDVYVYERWTSSTPLPKFTLGERFEPDEAMITEGNTTPPGYLTEPDLIALMDANGIGTDATMAEHIAKIKEREYVFTRPKAGGAAGGNNDDNTPAAGRQGGVEEFIPTTLGVALVEGYDNMEFEVSLSKPFLRKQMELKMKAICEGQKSRGAVVRESLTQYHRVFLDSKERVDVLKAACRKYVLNNGGAGP
ncbi:hypothetical protein EYC84_007476 [Monilinia fructicola]|uniref:DNA topoisomerase n=1 Tax=Monilinia fructicola TaxID=38448 RepID=A0A5M9JGD9_MONFR|nr:hypothetical protein EYC84_007476 [Monilinia fructicola]